MKPALPLFALCTAGALAGLVAAGSAAAGQGIAVATLSLPDAFPYETALAASPSSAPASAAPARTAEMAAPVVRPTVSPVAADGSLLVQTAAAPAPTSPSAAQGGPPTRLTQAAPAEAPRQPPAPVAEAAPERQPPFAPPGFPPQGFPPQGFPPHGFPPPRPDPIEVAGLLSAQEIALGIRADQIDVWRAFASAVVDFVAVDGPPPPPEQGSRPKPEPFGLPQAIASRAVEAGAKAKAVLDARTALLARLTPAQIERARKMDMPPPPPPGPGAFPEGPPPFAPPRP
ncbi:MAG: hypothetical protein B7X76_07455 [Azorhizobium sp. 39-67-5]|nr:MAG: hypothetical protein B7X76_07455 [Azorhizobium sp. 39-67-5]